MEQFLRNFPMAYQFVIWIALLIVGAALALPGGKKWGWLLMALAIAGMIITTRYKGLI
ncbi:MAG TPA: hypothetical protein PLB62_10460 [Candidatus Sumerlaeota bacterium]|nr:hypothetical protein [Candidatus Sumerlaeota bacterium]